MDAENFFELAGQRRINYNGIYCIEGHVTLAHGALADREIRKRVGEFGIEYFSCNFEPPALYTQRNNDILKRLLGESNTVTVYCQPDQKRFEQWHRNGSCSPRIKVFAIERNGEVVIGSKEGLEGIIE